MFNSLPFSEICQAIEELIMFMVKKAIFKKIFSINDVLLQNLHPGSTVEYCLENESL